MATRSTLVKVSMFTTRKEGASEADFHRYWKERHSKVVSEWLQRHGVVRYSQYHTPSWSQNKAKENISVLPDAAYATFDGVVEMWMLNEKCFQDAIDDPYYAAVVKADEEGFADASKTKVSFGWEEVYIEDGKILSQG
ncbi:hypothetical protein Q7P35_004210 [Cladosporium inversicolor]